MSEATDEISMYDTFRAAKIPRNDTLDNDGQMMRSSHRITKRKMTSLTSRKIKFILVILAFVMMLSTLVSAIKRTQYHEQVS